MEEQEKAAHILFDLMKDNGWSFATAESCTGGNIAHQITLIPGSSSFFKGGIVSYSNEVKMNVLGVKAESLEKYGAVSQSVVEQMAEGAVRVIGSDFAVATSGVAGPDGGTPEKPVGTVWMAVSNGKKTLSRKFLFGTDRKENIEKATAASFFLTKEFAGK
ncbi:MAG TPA: CinA family protein [Paludibacteraceae bacterium]|nr:CinA family protein [Paludibacteraceae bacterium]HOU69630.1 CinA family protein [Paludibacteraceae bacterium]HPH64008.1 CinA family protein [Paludibacteraceae bacterium]HQF51271.1 CinA family protein [Paludibacteraceae bacterium]